MCRTGGGAVRQEHDTGQTVLALTDYIYTGFNNDSQITVAIFADLAKAFDSLDRGILIEKLSYS